MFIRNRLDVFFCIDDLSSADKIALLLWLGVAGWLIINSLYFPGGSVVFNYLEGANRWLDNDRLYAGPEGYLYLPQFAMLFSFQQFPLFSLMRRKLFLNCRPDLA